jgi:alkaline phosphatase D
MKTNRSIPVILILLLLVISGACNREKNTYKSDWHQQPDRVWVGQDMWANRLQDWRLEDGKLICVNSRLGFRTVHLLTHQLGEITGEANIEVSVGLNPFASRKGADGWAGILIGAGEDQLDYRASALIHHSPGKTGGIIVAVNEYGQLVFLDNTGERENFGSMPVMPELEVPDSVFLTMNIYPGEDSQYTISASVVDPSTREVISSNTLTNVDPIRLLGNIALASNHIEEKLDSHSYWFSHLKVSGEKIAEDFSHRFGPVLGVQYTLSKGKLKLTAQLPPIGEEDDQFMKLWTREKGAVEWTLADSVGVRKASYTVPFSMENWESTKDIDYRLTYRVNDIKGRKRTFFYTGTIAADPVDKQELVVGAFACISHSHGNINGSNFDYTRRIWFPHTEFVNSVVGQKPDILFFTGDQVYEGRPTHPDMSSPENTELDYLYKWYLFLWTVEDLTRNIPTVSIPDDHDVYHGNVWGAGGRKAPAFPADSIYPEYYGGQTGHWQQDQGGYKLRASSVNMIQETQTSHLPDPYDSAPVEQGIDVYYTDLNYSRISFAILEDRKFKSAPSVMLPDARVINGFAQNRNISGRGLDNPDAKLLGDRQLEFIDHWTGDWYETDMKATISQTIFANLSTYPSTFKTDAGTPGLKSLPAGVVPEGYRVAKDMDSNGWPQTGRNKALQAIRKGFPVMIAGDQHLGSLIQMGVERWDDAGYSFCVPAIGNLWPRRWFPPEPGRDQVKGMPSYTGKYFDGFGNRINVWAVANPVETGKTPIALYDRAVGYGIIKFNKTAGEITFECWKREADPADQATGMFPGWPRTISMLDNYNRAVRSWLPNYEVSGLSHHPVFQVTDELTEEIIYTVRVPGDIYQPGVFDYSGTYTIKIGDPDSEKFKVFEHVNSSYRKKEEIVRVEF